MYVGQTCRQLATWVEEHREEHQIDWNAVTVLESEINFHHQIVLELAYSQTEAFSEP